VERLQSIKAEHPRADSPLEILHRRRDVTKARQGWAPDSVTHAATPVTPGEDCP